MTTPSPNLGWLLTDFTKRVASVAHAVVVTADGLVLAHSDRLPADRAEHLAAVVSGVVSLTVGAARCFGAGAVRQTIVEMEHGYLFVAAIGDGSSLAVLAAPDCELGLVGYEMQRQADAFGRQFTPQMRQLGQPGAAG